MRRPCTAQAEGEPAAAPATAAAVEAATAAEQGLIAVVAASEEEVVAAAVPPSDADPAAAAAAAAEQPGPGGRCRLAGGRHRQGWQEQGRWVAATAVARDEWPFFFCGRSLPTPSNSGR